MESSNSGDQAVLQNITNDSAKTALSKQDKAKPKTEKDSQKKPQTENQIDISDEEEEEEEELFDIDFPRDSAQNLHQFLHREINNLQNMEDPQKRKFALIRLYQIFVQAKVKAPNKIYQELLPMIQKPLFKRLSDKQEKCREIAALLIKEFFVRAGDQNGDFTMSIPYLMPILVERLNAYDLEGTETLPDVMKPPITQKPQVMVDPPESSEEVRVVLAEIVTVMVSQTVFECLRPYVDQFVNIIRALCMDPFGDVIIEGCSAMCEFAQNGGDQLLHFSENMARSLFTAFINKHAKVRMAGLTALYHVLFCGIWKYNANIMEHLIGFRDPNLVPIRDFYEISTKLNYFALFVSDRSTVVRDHFYKTIADLSMKLPDKKDHEGRFFPYLISGLFDSCNSVQDSVFELIEELGQQYEEEYEKDIRELKQLGFHPEWSYEGKVRDSDLSFSIPFLHRPRLGSRILVRSYVRRYLPALYKEINDWIEENRERASHLMLCCIIYTEDFMTQFMDNVLVALYKAVQEKDNKVVKKNITLCLKFLGRYCSPKAYGPMIIQAIRNELASYYPYTQSGAVKAFGFIVSGAIEIIPKGAGLERFQELLQEFVQAINLVVIDQLDQELADNLIETLTNIVDALVAKQEKEQFDCGIWVKMQEDFFFMVMRSLGVYSNFKLLNKADTEHVAMQKKKCVQLLNKFSLLYKEQNQGDDEDVFDKNISQYFSKQLSSEEHLEKAKDWSLMNHEWRLFYVVFDFLEERHLQSKVITDESSNKTAFSIVSGIIQQIMKNSESKNYNVKLIALTQMLPQLINKSLALASQDTTQSYLSILVQASLIEFKSGKDQSNNSEEQAKNHLTVLKMHQNLIDCGGLVLNSDSVEFFNQFMLDFLEPLKSSKKEHVKVETLKVVHAYLKALKEQVLEQVDQINEKTQMLFKLNFLHDLTEQIIKYLTDYFDAVREQGQLTLAFLLDFFMPLGFQDILSNNNNQAAEEHMHLLQLLRANASMGWSGQMGQRLKDAAEMEAGMARHLFKDPQQFIKNVIAIMMDESHGREQLIKIIKQFNTKMPFIVLNDFRIAHATNSFRRVEILRDLIFKEYQ